MTGKRARQCVLPPFDCVCATVRRASRLLTQLYDEEMRPHLEAPQFALLSALERHPGCRQSALAKAAGFDKTTLSRNLALMKRNGWIELLPADDQREHRLQLTAPGREALRAARPGWNRAQKRLKSAMASEEWDQIWHVLDTLTNAAYQAAYQARQKNGGQI